MRRAIITVTAISLFGCSHIQSTYVGSKPTTSVLPGIQYRLPKTIFDISATFEISNCQLSAQGNTLDLAYTTSVKVDELTKGDPDATYALDFEKLSGFTKTNKVTATTTETGVLVLIGASATDHSAGLIADSVKTIANIAIASTIPQVRIPFTQQQDLVTFRQKLDTLKLPPPETLRPYSLVLEDAKIPQPKINEALQVNQRLEQVDPCSKINDALSQIKNSKQGVAASDTAQKELTNLTGKIEQLQNNIAYAKSEIEFHEKNKNGDRKLYFASREKELTYALELAKDEKLSAQKTVDKYKNSQANLAAAQNKLKVTRRYTLLLSQPSNEDIAKNKSQPYIEKNSLSIGVEGITQVLNLSSSSGVEQCPSKNKNSICVNEIPQVEILLARSTHNDQFIGSNGKAVVGTDGRSGIFYRVPGEARLRVCQKACGDFDTKTDIINQAVSVAQLGTVGNITLKNMMFDDNLIDVSFHPNGSLQKMTFESEAQSEEARKAAIGASENYLNFVKERNTAVRTANTEAQTGALADLQSQKNQLTEKQTILNMLQGQPASTTQNRIEAYEKQIELLQVQRRLIEEQRLTEEAMKGSSPSL